RRRRRLLGEADGVLHLRLGLAIERPELLVGRDTEGADAPGDDAERVALHPLLHLLLGAVLGRVRDRLAAAAVGLRLVEERRAVAEEAEGHVRLAAVLAPDRHPGRDRHVAADDRPAAEEALGGGEEVHRAAAPAAAAGRASVALGHRAARVTGAREVVRVLA